MKNQTGNALFLILIAVALFAALSYAVTQSGRGGSGIDKEEAEIAAARIMQIVSDIQTTLLRLKITDGYDQVWFDDSAPNDSGTCYSGATATSPCRTVGIFHSSVGLPVFDLGFAVQDNPINGNYWFWIVSRAQVGGSDAGTSLPDEFLWFDHLDQNVCDALNRKLRGNTTQGTSSGDSDSQGQFYSYITDALVINGPVPGTPTGYVFDYMPGCTKYATRNVFAYMLEEN